jgi:amino acid permease
MIDLMRNSTNRNVTIRVTVMTLLIVMVIVVFVGHQGPLVIGKETNDRVQQTNGQT